MNTQREQTKYSVSIKKVPVIFSAIVVGLVVNTLGTGMWPLLGTSLSIPLAFVGMSIFLWAYVKYFSGSWAPQNTVNVRKENFRSIHLTKSVWVWGSIAAGLFFISKMASGEFVFRFWAFPEDAYATTLTYFEQLSPINAILAIVMTSVVAGIAEEIGFRGYMQRPLEKKYGPSAAIIIVSVVFTIMHIPQVSNIPYLLLLFTLSIFFGILAYATKSLIIGILIHAIMDTFAFLTLLGFLGAQEPPKPTIFESGVDVHFLITGGIFIISTLLFARTINMLLKSRTH